MGSVIKVHKKKVQHKNLTGRSPIGKSAVTEKIQQTEISHRKNTTWIKGHAENFAL